MKRDTSDSFDETAVGQLAELNTINVLEETKLNDAEINNGIFMDNEGTERSSLAPQNKGTQETDDKLDMSQRIMIHDDPEETMKTEINIGGEIDVNDTLEIIEENSMTNMLGFESNREYENKETLREELNSNPEVSQDRMTHLETNDDIPVSRKQADLVVLRPQKTKTGDEIDQSLYEKQKFIAIKSNFHKENLS